MNPRPLSAALVFLALAACAHAPDPGIRRADPPLPRLEPGVARQDEVFQGAGGLALYGRGYRPQTGDVRGVVVFMNGLKDHGDHYASLSQRLVLRGYAAYAFDLRGHGRSAGARVTVDRFDDYLDDLEIFVARVRAHEPEKPIFVFGHSLGGAVVALYAIERHPRVAGIILSGPALAFDQPPIAPAVIRVSDALTPAAPLLDPKHPDFSRDPAVVADMDRDPLVFQPPGPVHTAAEAVDATRRIWAHPEDLTVPLLAIHGTADKLTAPSGSRDLVTRAGATDKTLRLYGGFFHDLVHEPGGERVVADIEQWLDAHTGGSVAAPASSLPDRGQLVGDQGSKSTSVEIDGRAERALAVSGAATAATGGLRLRQGFGAVGWLGGLDLRAGSEAGFRWEADAYPLGFGARFGGSQLGLVGGIGARGVDGVNVVRVPTELSFEIGLGPTRVLTRGGISWRLNHGGPGTSVLRVADEANGLVGLRLGRDLRYWADVTAGAGPYLGVTYSRRDSVDIWGLALGLELWGAN